MHYYGIPLSGNDEEDEDEEDKSDAITYFDKDWCAWTLKIDTISNWVVEK